MAPPNVEIYLSSTQCQHPAPYQAFGLTYENFHSLHTAANEAKSRAYCPYSKFRVGAALLISKNSDVEVIAGCNVENAAYPVGTCAERVAFGNAVANGILKPGQQDGGIVKAVAVITDVEVDMEKGTMPASPCGMCRQFIREFCDLNVPIIMFDKNGNYAIMRLEELLPLSFGPENLGVPGPSR